MQKFAWKISHRTIKQNQGQVTDMYRKDSANSDIMHIYIIFAKGNRGIIGIIINNAVQKDTFLRCVL